MAQVTVHFFGPATDDAGCAQTRMALDGPMGFGEFTKRLFDAHPRLAARAEHLRFAINERYATTGDTVRPGDVIAVIPPVSGGSDHEGSLIRLEREPINVDGVRACVLGGDDLGGIVTFEGATRMENDPEHGRLVRLDYQAYEAMALRQMAELAEAARARWPVGRVAIVHRVGAVAPGEVSVMIAVACPHRAEAFEACRWLIDTLKRDVPIWKREVWADEATSWVDPTREST